MPTPTVAYSELANGIDEEGEIGQARCVRVYQTAWSDRWAFAEQAFGFIRTSGNIMLRGLPWEYPYRPGLYPRRFRFRPKGRHYANGSFDYCHCEVTFTDPEFQDSATDSTTGSISLYSIRAFAEPEFRTIPDSQLKFSSDNKPVGQPVAAIWPNQGYELTLHRVPFFPRSFLKPLVGRCNQNAITVGNETFAAETLALKGWNAEREITFSGEGIQIPAWNVTLILAECDYGFNTMVRPDTGSIAAITPAGGIVPRSTAFDRLLWLTS